MADPTMPGLPAARNPLEAQPDLLRELVEHTVNALLSADADALCGARYGERVRAAHQPPQRLPRAALGHPRRHHRPADPQAARGQLLPRLAARAPPPRGEGADQRGRRSATWPASRPAGWRRRSRRWASSGISKSQVSRLCAEPRRAGRGLPHPPAGRRPVPLRDARRPGRQGARGRPHRQRLRGARHRRQRRRLSRERWASTSSPPRTAPPGWPSCAAWWPAACQACSWSPPTPTRASSTPSARTLPGASWQRCRTHFMRNLLTRVPRSMHRAVATLVRTIFDQPDAATWCRSSSTRTLAQLEERFPTGRRAARGGRPRPARLRRLPAQESGARSGATTPSNG